MVSVKDIEKIRHDCLVKKKPVAKVAREMGLSRTTVTKYLKPINLSQTPDMKKKHPNRTLLEQYRAIFLSYLDEDAVCYKKQRHTATRMYERIIEEYPDFPCSKPSTMRYCSELRKEYFDTHYGYLPLEYEYGQAEFDFGDATFYLNEQKIEGKYACLTFPQSNATYMQLLKQKNAEAAAMAMTKIFEFIGGVPHTIWFDNDTAFVIKRRVGKKMVRIKTDCYRRFNLHYSFKEVFLPPFKPGIKMDVEVGVKETRRHLLVPMPKIDDLEKYNEKLLERSKKYNDRAHCTMGGTVNDVHFADLMKLEKLPDYTFTPCTVYKKRFDSYGRFTFEKNSYYIDPAVAEHKMQIQVWPYHIEIYTENGEPYEKCLSCPRLVGERGRWLNWPPYVRVLANKPAAILNFPFINLFDDESDRNWITCLNRNQLKSFLIKMADEMDKVGVEEAIKNVKTLLEDYPLTKLDDSEEKVLQKALQEGGINVDPIKTIEAVEDEIYEKEESDASKLEEEALLKGGIPDALDEENEIDESAILPDYMEKGNYRNQLEQKDDPATPEKADK